MKAFFFILLTSRALTHFQPLFLNEEAVIDRIAAHLIIDDKISAYRELSLALSAYPESLPLRQLFIQVSAESGRILEALTTFKELKQASLLSRSERHHLLEELAWGILLQGEESTKLNVRLTALLGASFTRDLRGAKAIGRALDSSNAVVRALAVQFAVSYRDDVLCERLIDLLVEEKSPIVLSRIIWAVGQLKLTAAIPQLESLLEYPHTSSEIKALIFQTLARMHEKIERLALRKLLLSDRIFMRGLGCEIIAYLNIVEEKESLVALLGDSSLIVRMQALSALASFPSTEIAPLIPRVLSHVQSTTPILELMGASLALRTDHPQGRPLFEKHLRGTQETQRLAAGMLKSCGPRAISLMRDASEYIDDLYAKATLALGLIGLRHHVEYACHNLYQFLEKTRDLIMFDSSPHPRFLRISPSEVNHTPQLARYPEFVDHRTRLELLTLLSILHYSQSEEAIKGFLRKGHWSVGASAMVLLLEQGAIQSVDTISAFLDDPDVKLRLGAALALAFIGKDPRATEVLCDLYPKVDRETKLVILEALTSVGSEAALPTLIYALEEPSHILKIAAASGIIQSLNH